MFNGLTRAVANAALAGCILLAAAAGQSLAAANEQAVLPDGIFATVDGVTITDEEFERFLVGYARSKAYHGTTAEELLSLKPEAAEAIIRQKLLIAEAARRGMESDAERVDQQIANLEDRYKDSDRWDEVKSQLPLIHDHMLQKTRIDALEAEIRRVDEPDEQALARYYEANLEKFTQPERLHLDLLLIGVEPWQTSEVWSQAQGTAEELYRKLADGADFAALAQRHSSHDSAQAGGDLGFIHKGLLAQQAQDAVDELALGEIATPVRILEGFAIFRLVERQESRLHPLAAVRERASALHKRDRAGAQWRQFVESLWKKAQIVAANEFLKGGPE